jgi:hypothetical protein
MIVKDKCKEYTTVSRVQVSERCRKATFLNPDNFQYLKVRVDNCIVENATAADWLISKEGIGDVIVELKGRNVEHAVKQINATAELWTGEGLRTGKLAALIVATQYPSANTAIQKAQQAFSKKYNGPLHVVTRNAEYCFECVLSFKGPHGSVSR